MLCMNQVKTPLHTSLQIQSTHKLSSPNYPAHLPAFFSAYTYSCNYAHAQIFKSLFSLPRKKSSNTGENNHTGVDWIGNSHFHYPVWIGRMVKCEEEGIRNNAKHPEDDKADYKTKPLQPYLYRKKSYFY